MYRLSLIINEVYLKYLPLAEKAGITLNLDFPNTDQQIDDKDGKKGKLVRAELEKSLNAAVGRKIKGEVTISVHKDKIMVRDSETVVSKTICAILSNDHVQVKSRVGFGTTVTIFF